MKKAQKNQGWPAVLYMTPEKWSPFGEVFVVDERELRQMVRELRDLGEDWRKVRVSDAVPIRLVRADGDDKAVYEGGKLYRVWRYRFPDGEARYDWCELDLCEEEGE